MKPHLTLIETHRPVIVFPPVDYDLSPPVGLHTTDELIFAGWLGGFIGVVVTVVAAAIWSFA